MSKRPWHKVYPPQVPAEIDFEKITVPQMLTQTANRFPKNVAITYEGSDITYRLLNDLVNRFAHALTALGLEKGQRTAILLPNIPQTVIAYQAALRIGAITVMNNPIYTPTELAHQFKDSEASFVITTDEYLEKALTLKRQTGIRCIVTCSPHDFAHPDKKQISSALPPSSDAFRFLDLIEEHSSSFIDNQAEWDQVANIMYTGGTTGVSKGVMQTHANLSCNAQQYSAWMCDTTDGEESWPLVYPIFHSAGYTMQNKSIHTGWKSILISRPTPEEMVNTIAETKPTLLPGVATLFVGLLNYEKFYELDLSSIKAFMTGGGVLAVETLRQLKQKKDVPVINVYGLTEASPVVTATPWLGPEKAGSVGVPYPSTDLKIVDPIDGLKEMPQGEPGEILVKGPQIMKGYLNRLDETENVLKEGWLHTGDIGVMDEEGYLTIVDRKKDVIVASGFNVYPKEIDELLFAHPKVLEACTIGVPHEYRGETVKSFVVLRDKAIMEESELINYCRQHLAPYKVPRLLEFTDSLPKSPIGKILRKDLREKEKHS